jgi:hypothetical protein
MSNRPSGGDEELGLLLLGIWIAGVAVVCARARTHNGVCAQAGVVLLYWF